MTITMFRDTAIAKQDLMALTDLVMDIEKGLWPTTSKEIDSVLDDAMFKIGRFDIDAAARVTPLRSAQAARGLAWSIRPLAVKRSLCGKEYLVDLRSGLQTILEPGAWSANTLKLAVLSYSSLHLNGSNVFLEFHGPRPTGFLPPGSINPAFLLCVPWEGKWTPVRYESAGKNSFLSDANAQVPPEMHDLVSTIVGDIVGLEADKTKTGDRINEEYRLMQDESATASQGPAALFEAFLILGVRVTDGFFGDDIPIHLYTLDKNIDHQLNACTYVLRSYLKLPREMLHLYWVATDDVADSGGSTATEVDEDDGDHTHRKGKERR